MENQHKHITGYRDLSQGEVNLINKIKAKASEIESLVQEVKSHESVDQRWAAIGVTNLQQGFMALTRSVAKPTTF